MPGASLVRTRPGNVVVRTLLRRCQVVVTFQPSDLLQHHHASTPSVVHHDEAHRAVQVPCSHILGAHVQAQTRQTTDSCVVDKSALEGAADALAAGFLRDGDDDFRDVRRDVSVAVVLVREVAVPSPPGLVGRCR